MVSSFQICILFLLVLEAEVDMYFNNSILDCTGKAHIVVGIDLSTESRFKNALDFVSVLFWNVRQIRRSLLLNDVNKYAKTFSAGEDSAGEFNTLFNAASSSLNNGNYDAKDVLERLSEAYNALPTTIHTVRVLVLITDREPTSSIEMSQAAALLQSLNIKVIVVSMRDNFNAQISKFRELTQSGLENSIVVSDFTLLGSGLNQMINAICNGKYSTQNYRL